MNIQQQKYLDQFEKILYISATHRRSGYTTMMLKAAMHEPNCVIVSRDMATARWVETRYDQLYNEVFHPKSIYKKILVKVLLYIGILSKSTEKPKFMSLDSRLEGYNSTVFFDNSCFFM